jgi:hypothetical protein
MKKLKKVLTVLKSGFVIVGSGILGAAIAAFLILLYPFYASFYALVKKRPIQTT